MNVSTVNNNSDDYFYLNESGENVSEDTDVSLFLDDDSLSTDDISENSDAEDMEISSALISDVKEVEKVDDIDDVESSSLITDSELSADDFVSTLDDTTVTALIEVLESIVSAQEKSLNSTKDNNGVIAKAWDWVKNKTGIGQGSDKVQSEIDDLKSQIEELKSDPSKLAEVYENVTGNELTADELTSLVNGEADFSDSEIVNSVSKYQQGQKQVVNTVSTIASGLTVVGLVTAGVVAAPFTGGMSLGASLAAIGTLTAAGTAAYMVPQVIDGVTEEDGYSASETIEDLANAVITSSATAVSMGVGKAVGSSLSKTVTQKTAQFIASETTSVLMSDSMAVGNYLVEVATNDDVDFSLETLGTTAATATAAGLAAGGVAFGTSSVLRPILTSGTTATSQVAGRLISSGISGASAGAAASAAAGSTSYLISCSVNGEETSFDDWLDATTENVAAGALTGFCAGVCFEAVQIAAGTPAPDGTASKRTGTTEDGLKYTEYLDEDGNVIARDVKVSDIKSYRSGTTELAQSSSNNSTELSTETATETSSSSTARTVRFTYNSSNVITQNENGTYTPANEYATVNDIQVYDWADNLTFSAAQSISNAYNDADIIDTNFVEEPVNYSSESAAIIEQNASETVVVENGTATNNSAYVIQDSTAETTSIIISDSALQPVNIFADSTSAAASEYGLALTNNSAINSTAAQTSLSAAQTSTIAAVSGSVNYLSTNNSANTAISALSAAQSAEETITAALANSDASLDAFGEEYGIQNSSAESQVSQSTENVNETVQNVSNSSDTEQTSILSLEDIAKMSTEEKAEYLKNKGVNLVVIEEIISMDLNDTQYQRAIELLDKGVDLEDIKEITSLDDIKYQKFIKLYNGFNMSTIKEIISMDLNDTQYQRAVELLDKGVDSSFIEDIVSLDDTQYQRAVELLDKGVDSSFIEDIVSLDDTQYQRAVELLNKELNPYYIKDMVSLDDIQYQRAVELLDKGVVLYEIKDIASLDDTQYQRYIELFDKGVLYTYIKDLVSLDDTQYQRAIELLDKGVSEYDIQDIVSLDDIQYQKYIELLDRGIKPSYIENEDMLSWDDTQYQRYYELRDKGVDSAIIEEIISMNLDDIQYQRAVELLNKGVDSSYIKDIVSLDDAQYQSTVELFDKGVNISSIIEIISMDLDDPQYLLVMGFLQKFTKTEHIVRTIDIDKTELQNGAGTQVKTSVSWDYKNSKIKVTETIEPDGTSTIERTEKYEDGTSTSWYIKGDRSFNNSGKYDKYGNGILSAQTEIIYDKETNEPKYVIATKKSGDLEGVYEKTLYTLEDYPEDYDVLAGIKDGTIEGGTQLTRVTVNENGSITYTENVSSNGSNIQRTYTQGTNGTDYDYHYTITDESGTQILDTSVSFTKNSDNQTTTVINGVEYVAKFDDSTYTIEISGSDGTVLTMNISEMVDSDLELEECWQAAKNLTSDSLKTLSKIGKWTYVDDGASMHNDNSVINSGDNSHITDHELGHAKDNIIGLSNDTELIKIYNSEFEIFMSRYTDDSGQAYIKYFSQNGGSGMICEGGNTGLSEVIAETNMLLINYGHNTTKIETRAQFLAQNFPETISYIASKLGLNAAGQE